MVTGVMAKACNYPFLVWKNTVHQGLKISLDPRIVYRGLPTACLAARQARLHLHRTLLGGDHLGRPPPLGEFLGRGLLRNIGKACEAALIG